MDSTPYTKKANPVAARIGIAHSLRQAFSHNKSVKTQTNKRHNAIGGNY